METLNRRSFSRISKLMSIFGYGSSTPYNSNLLSKRLKSFVSGYSPLGQSTNGQWYDSKFKDSTDFNTRMSDWKDMLSYSPIAAAVKLIVEECIQTEHSCPSTIWAEGGDSETENEINDLFRITLQCEDVIRSQFWWIVGYGNNFEKLVLGPNGVHGWYNTPLDTVKRVVDEMHRLVGFSYTDEEPPDNDGSCVIWGDPGSTSAAKLWRPWDFIHMRLMGEDRNSEYGTSLLYPAANVYKKLRMSEDQMVTYRLQMQPSRYVLTVDTGEATAPDVRNITNMWKNALRKNRQADVDNNIYEVRYNPWALDDLIILPKRKDSATNFEKLQGDSDLPDITDVKYLTRLLFGMINVPGEFCGLENEGGNTLTSQSSLATQDLRFQRSIKAIRSPLMNGYDYVGRIHLALMDKDPFVPYRVKMSNLCAIESQSQLELTDAQSSLAEKLIQLGNSIKAPQEEWIRMIFTKFMPLPDDLVDLISIGNLVDRNDESGDISPMGRSLDFGNDLSEPTPPPMSDEPSMPEMPQSQDLSSTDVNLPDLPQEASKALPIVHHYLTEMRKIREQKQLDLNRKYSKQLREYFNPYYSFKRYKRNHKMLMESVGISSPEGLVQLREDISKNLRIQSSNLGRNRPVLREVGKIIRIVEGYYPTFFDINMNQLDKIVESSKVMNIGKRQPKKPLNESMEHEILTTLKKSSRK